jgi:hypothetical protein
LQDLALDQSAVYGLSQGKLAADRVKQPTQRRGRAKTNRMAISTELLAAELTDVVLITGGHFGGFNIAGVGIVRLNSAFARFVME